MKAIPIKNSREIEQMRDSARLATSILERLAAAIAPGMTTKEVDEMAAGLMKDAGARSAFLGYKKFPGHICISLNEEVVHGIGGPRRIQYGDLVKLDVGVVYNGWVGDTATTVAVGLVDAESRALMDVTEAALYHAIAYAREGRRLGDLCAAVDDFVSPRGYGVVREFVGHGVGRKLHEEPQVPNFGKRGTGPKLKAGMIMCIEPMITAGDPTVRVLGDKWTVITADRSLSAHYEHTVLVTRGEPEILTLRGERPARSARTRRVS